MSQALVSGYDSESSKSSDDENPIEKEQVEDKVNEPDKLREIPKEESKSTNVTASKRSAKQKKVSKKRKRFKKNPNTYTGSDLPLELAEELSRSGHSTSDVNFVEINAVQHAALPVTESDHKQSQQAVLAAASRITKGTGVSRTERRKHQITALAADVAALQAARKSVEESLPDSIKKGKIRKR